MEKSKCTVPSTGCRCLPVGINGNETLVSILIHSLQISVLGLHCNVDSACSECSTSA